MTTYIGPGSIEKLEEILSDLKANNVLLVSGLGSFELSGANTFFQHLMGKYQFARHASSGLYTRVEDVVAGIDKIRSANYDAIIAVGGGRVLDLAKLMRFFAYNQVSMQDYLAGKTCQPGESPPLVAVPTTAGSGSEETKNAVVYLDGLKHSVSDPTMKPEYAVVDARLTANLPAAMAAACGMDALSQSIESYWSVRSTDESRAHSKAGIRLAMENLRQAVKNRTDSALEAMSRSANLSGRAINITTTTAPHAVSYPFTSRFGVPHGHAVALTLPEFFLYNDAVSQTDIIDPRGVDFVRSSVEELNHLLDSKSAAETRDTLRQLMHDIGLSCDLKSLGVVSKVDISNIVDATNLERLSNNPRKVTAASLTELLSELIGGD